MINIGSPIYLKAFEEDINQIWNSLSEFQDTTTQMSYYRALSSFLRDGIDGDAQRRALMYYHLESLGFEVSASTATANRLFNSIPTGNLEFTRALNNIAQVYNNPPTRDFEIDNEDLKETLVQYLDDSGYNTMLHNLHKTLKSCSKVAVRPLFKQGQLTYDILLPDEFQEIKDDSGRLLEIWIPFYEGNYNAVDDSYTSELMFEVWTDETYRVTNNSGATQTSTIDVSVWNGSEFVTEERTFEELDHGLGQVPYQVIDIKDKDLFQAMRRQLDINFLDFCSNQDVVFSAFAQQYLVNFGKGASEKAVMSPGYKFFIDGITSEDVPPFAETVDTETFFEQFNEFKNQIIVDLYKALGLPGSIIDSNPGLAASGEALKADWREMLEKRQEDIVVLKIIDNSMVSLVAKIIDLDIGSPTPGIFNGNYDVSMSINYQELQTFEDPNEKLERIESYRSKGLIDPLRYYFELTQDESVKTNEQAIEKINENLELFSQITTGNTENDGTRESNTASNIANEPVDEGSSAQLPETDSDDNNGTVESDTENGTQG